MIDPRNKRLYNAVLALAFVALIAAMAGLVVLVIYFPDGLFHRA